MRLVGIALLTAWLLAWAAAPHGEPAPQSSLLGGVAAAGGDRAAVAWLELRHEPGAPAPSGALHVATVDEAGRVAPRLAIGVGADAVAFRLADAGEGRFVLAAEYRNPARRWFEVHRIGPIGVERLDDVASVLDAGGWQLAAAGDEVALVETDGDRSEVHLLDADGDWLPSESAPRTLVGAGMGHLVRYEIGRHRDRLVYAPARLASWAGEVGSPDCADAAHPDVRPTVRSVVALRGGYARLAVAGSIGCVDGLRDGKPFSIAHLPLAQVASPVLVVATDGTLAIHDDAAGMGSPPRLHVSPLDPLGADDLDCRGTGCWSHFQLRGVAPYPSWLGTRQAKDHTLEYRVFGSGGARWVTSLLTTLTPEGTQLTLERQPIERASGLLASTVRDPDHVSVPLSTPLASTKRWRPDGRPALRRLAALPLLVLGLAALGALQLVRRLRKLAPLPPDAPLVAGPAAVEATLATDAESPAGGLRLRRERGAITLHLDGADVLRASDLRPRDQPRGDAVDVAAGAPIVATGAVEPGDPFRGGGALRARRGDLVVAGCTLAELRARARARLVESLLLLAAATSLVLLVTRG